MKLRYLPTQLYIGTLERVQQLREGGATFHVIGVRFGVSRTRIKDIFDEGTQRHRTRMLAEMPLLPSLKLLTKQ